MRTIIISLLVAASGAQASTMQDAYLAQAFSSHPSHELPVFHDQQLSISLGAVPEKLMPYVPVFRDACIRHGLRANLFLAIAEQENVSPAYLNPLGLSNDSGPYHFRSWEEAQAAIEHQAELISSPVGAYSRVRTIDDLAAVYSPVGAVNDPYHTNGSEASGIKENLRKLEGR